MSAKSCLLLARRRRPSQTRWSSRLYAAIPAMRHTEQPDSRTRQLALSKGGAIASRPHLRGEMCADSVEIDDAAIEEALARTRERIARVPKNRQTEALRQIIANAELVLGVFDDSCLKRGWDCLVVKGHSALDDVATSGIDRVVSVSAIPCSCVAEAVAMKEIFGGLH